MISPCPIHQLHAIAKPYVVVATKLIKLSSLEKKLIRLDIVSHEGIVEIVKSIPKTAIQDVKMGVYIEFALPEKPIHK